MFGRAVCVLVCEPDAAESVLISSAIEELSPRVKAIVCDDGTDPNAVIQEHADDCADGLIELILLNPWSPLAARGGVIETVRAQPDLVKLSIVCVGPVVSNAEHEDLLLRGVRSYVVLDKTDPEKVRSLVKDMVRYWLGVNRGMAPKRVVGFNI